MKLARTTVATCLAILLAVTATAQTKGKIRISGKVVNEMGQPVEGAEVRAANTAMCLCVSRAKTDTVVLDL